MTPPAIPLNNTPVTLKVSSAICVVRVALTMLTPDKKSTTSFPARVPSVKVRP